MKIYKDILTGDEIFSERYKMKLVNKVMYKVYGKIVTEVAEDGTDKVFEHGVDFASNHRLVETKLFDKNSFLIYLYNYKQKIVAKLQESSPDQVDVFKRNLSKVVKRILARFENLQFFTGKSMDSDSMPVIIEYRNVGGDNIPVLYAFKHGLEEVEML